MFAVLLAVFVFMVYALRTSENFKIEVVADAQVRQKALIFISLHRQIRLLLQSIQDSSAAGITVIQNQRPYQPYSQVAYKIIINNLKIVQEKWSNITLHELDSAQLNNGETTHVVLKGQKMFLGIRKRKQNRYFIPGVSRGLPKYSYTDEFFDFNILMYVIIHEAAHIFCPEFQHPPLFWDINKELMSLAKYFGLVEIVDYSKNPVMYYDALIKSNDVL